MGLLGRWLLLVFLSIPSFGLGQTAELHVKNLTSRKPDSAVVYANVCNTIQVYASNLEASNISVTSTGNIISHTQPLGDTIQFNINPTEKGTATINLTNRINGNTIGQMSFDVQTLSNDAIIRLGTLKENTVQKEILLLHDKLNISLPSSLYNPFLHTRVISYAFQTNYNGNDYYIRASSCDVTDRIRDIIKKAPPNTKITFTDIISSCPSCRPRLWPDLEILVK